MKITIVSIFVLSCATSGQKPDHSTSSLAAPLSRQADSRMLLIKAGTYLSGSTVEEREEAYKSAKETSGRDGARKGKWFDREDSASTKHLPGYLFDLYPVTQGEFAEFIAATGRAAPSIDPAVWKKQGFIQDYESEVKRNNWMSSKPPKGRAEHPAVLLPWKDADAYCRWRGSVVGKIRRLPSAEEFEKAARGPGGAIYPWGDSYQPDRLNSADNGPRDTQEIGTHPSGKSALGAFDVAGNVFQWTSTRWPRGKGRMTVKGSAWDDHGGLGRAAAAHGRRAFVRHVIVGFRCAGVP